MYEWKVFHDAELKLSCCFCLMCSQVPASSARSRGELPTVIPLPAKVNLGLVFGEGKDGHASQVAVPVSTSEGGTSLGEPEDDGNHSTASSQCSATYSNLGKKDQFKTKM